MIRKVGFILLVLCACLGSAWAGWWERFIIGPGGARMTTLAPGMGRNDGAQRIYAACFDSHIYEYTDSASQWYRRDMGSANALMTYAEVGRGRNDLINRVYGASNDTGVWEFTYDDSSDSWTKERIGNGSSYMNTVRVGFGRNDPIRRVYSGDWDGYVYEFTYQGNHWIQTSFPGPSYICDIAIGPGRGDSIPRIYSAGYYGDLVESTCDTLGWNSTPIWSGSGLQAVAIGKGRYVDTLSDRRDHVYIGAMNGDVYELLYQGSSWISTILGHGNGGMYSVAVGPGRGDGVNRVYGGCDDGKVYEFTYVRGVGWTQDTVGSANGHIDGVAIGLGEVIGGIYATSYDGMVYGFRYHQTGVEAQGVPITSIPSYRLSAFPNPCRDRSMITLSLEREELVNLDIYALDGRRIRALVVGNLSSGVHKIVWDGCDSKGLSAGPGLYFLRLTSSEGILTSRVLKLK
jgi:hypothetical protein